ncbi:UNVERIFIED_CONTAM: hypothetical protein K2H54_052589 [Gekko kuhli]
MQLKWPVITLWKATIMQIKTKLKNEEQSQKTQRQGEKRDGSQGKMMELCKNHQSLMRKKVQYKGRHLRLCVKDRNACIQRKKAKKKLGAKKRKMGKRNGEGTNLDKRLKELKRKEDGVLESGKADLQKGIREYKGQRHISEIQKKKDATERRGRGIKDKRYILQ